MTRPEVGERAELKVGEGRRRRWERGRVDPSSRPAADGGQGEGRRAGEHPQRDPAPLRLSSKHRSQIQGEDGQRSIPAAPAMAMADLEPPAPPGPPWAMSWVPPP
jgi:hypothetical protein